VDVVGTAVETNGHSTDVNLSTNALGELDTSLRLWNYPRWRGNSETNACYGDDMFSFSLVYSEKHSEIATHGTAKEPNAPRAWKVEDPSFEPLINLDTAVRYVTLGRDKSADPVVKRNAAKTLTILNYYKQGKLLPAQLSSGGTGGCG
jgi:hypothetical protein